MSNTRKKNSDFIFDVKQHFTLNAVSFGREKLIGISFPKESDRGFRMSESNNCRLCFSAENDQNLNIFSDIGIELRMSEIISEHFKCEVNLKKMFTFKNAASDLSNEINL